MALFISQNDERSELQKRLAAELQRKANEKALLADRPDGVDDSQYIKGLRSTGKHEWVWATVIVLIVAIIIWLTVVTSTR